MILYWLILPVLVTINQLLLKYISKSSSNIEFGFKWIWFIMSNPLMIIVLSCEILSFILWMKILSKSDLSKAYPITGVCYIVILITSFLVFGERINLIQFFACLLIVGGILLIGNSSKEHEVK